MTRTGGCNCGAVRFEITQDPDHVHACHCGMCRRFSGGVFLGVEVPADQVRFDTEEGLAVYRSSDWAERAFCKSCGSSLFYRLTAPGPMNGVCYIGIGTLDDANGLPLTGEIYIDCKPDGYAFAGNTDKKTEVEMLAMFSAP
ncbi:GFA family protein [Aliishimia ponticola]|nr:GFA family protein [Aliishimia ponticola]